MRTYNDLLWVAGTRSPSVLVAVGSVEYSGTLKAIGGQSRDAK